MVRLAGINGYNDLQEIYIYIDLQFRKPLSKKYVKIFLLGKKVKFMRYCRIIFFCIQILAVQKWIVT